MTYRIWHRTGSQLMSEEGARHHERTLPKGTRIGEIWSGWRVTIALRVVSS